MGGHSSSFTSHLHTSPNFFPTTPLLTLSTCTCTRTLCPPSPQNWDYTGVIEAFHNGEGKLYTQKVGLAGGGGIAEC